MKALHTLLSTTILTALISRGLHAAPPACQDSPAPCSSWSSLCASHVRVRDKCPRTCGLCTAADTWTPWTNCTRPCTPAGTRHRVMCSNGKAKCSVHEVDFQSELCNDVPCAPCPVSGNWKLYNNMCYQFNGKGQTWTKADEMCMQQTWQTILVEPRDPNTQKVVKRMSLDNKVTTAVWVGVYYRDNHKLAASLNHKFVWASSGIQVNWAVWGSDDAWRTQVVNNGTQWCVEYSSSAGGWNVADCKKNQSYICRREPAGVFSEFVSDDASRPAISHFMALGIIFLLFLCMK